MLILLISFLTIGVYVIFFITFYKAVKLVRRDMGFRYALALVVGLIVLLSNNNQGTTNVTPHFTVNNPVYTTLTDIHHTEYRIEKNVFHHIDLNLGIGKIKETGKLVAISATAFMNGMHIGSNWKPFDIILTPIPGTDSVNYYIIATVSSRWLFFSNDKSEEYTGTIVLR